MKWNDSYSGNLFLAREVAKVNLVRAAFKFSEVGDRHAFEDALAPLMEAALQFATTAALYGHVSDCARPAGAAGRAWKENLPLNQLLDELELE
jgi:hypothetical protein